MVLSKYKKPYNGIHKSSSDHNVSQDDKVLNTVVGDIGDVMNYQWFIYMKSTPSPFPNHAWYTKLRNRISSEQKKILQENVRITEDDKVEVIKMGEKYSILHKDGTGIIRNTWVDGIDKYRQGHTIQWEYKDCEGKTGIDWLSYFDAEAAEETIHVLPNTRCPSGEKKFHRLLNYLPGDTDEEKIKSLVDLLELSYTGTYIAEKNKWIQVGIMWYLRVSVTNTSDSTWRYALRIYFSDEIVGMDNNYSGVNSYIPTLVYERTKEFGDLEVTGDDFEYID